MKRVYLVGNGGVYAGSEIPVENEVIIGRDPKVCQLVFPETDRGVSGVHCKIQNSNGSITVTDLGSTNGTFLRSGERLSPNTPYTLQGGQGIYLGIPNNMFTIRVEEIAVPQLRREEVALQQTRETVLQPVQEAVQPRQNRGAIGIIVAVAVVVVGLITALALGSVNSARQDARQAQWEAERAQKELYEEQNKGILEKTLDTAEDWLDMIFN